MKSRHNRARLKGVCIGLSAMTAPWPVVAPASAQTASPVRSDSELEEITVTARRVEERAQSVPVAITALSARDLQSKGIGKAADLMGSVAGLFIAPGSNRGSNSPVFGVRGQLNRDPALTNDPSVGLYFADVPWARPGGSNAAFVDLQSVQVLKGPQGTLFGRNSTAGAILITPKAPVDKFEGYVRFGTGNYGLVTGEGVINVPLNDGLAVRLVGNYQRRDGYLTAANSGEVTNDLDNHSLRASVRWAPSSSFSSTFIGTYYKSSTNGDGARLIALSPAAPAANLAPLYARFAAALAATRALGRYQYLTSYAPEVYNTPSLGVPGGLTADQIARVKTWSIQNTSTLDMGSSNLLGDVSFKNIISLRNEHDGNTFETVSANILTAQSLSDQQAKQFTEEFQAQGKNGALDYVIGLFYFREWGHDRSRGYAVVPINRLTDNDVTNTSYSAFAHAGYDLSSLGLDGLSLAGGLRVTRDIRYWNNRNRNQTTPGVSASPLYTCNLQPTLPANDGSLCQYPSKILFTEPTWDVNLSYQIAPHAMIYASVARGYRSGGFSVNANTVAASAPFLPEKVLNYEIGAKSDFNLGGMPTRLNVAAFYTDYRDIQRTVNLIDKGVLLGNVTINAAKASIKGAELEFTTQPADGLRLSLSYAYLKPKYKSFVDQYLEPTNGLFYPVDVSDSQFIQISRHSLTASASYVLPLPESAGEPTLTASYYYRSAFFTTSDINTAHCSVPGDPNLAAIYTNCYNHAGRLPGYGLLNLRIDWRKVMGQRFDVALFVNNVTDKYYYPNALNALAAFGTMSVQIGAPRMFGAELTVPFGGSR